MPRSLSAPLALSAPPALIRPPPLIAPPPLSAPPLSAPDCLSGCMLQAAAALQITGPACSLTGSAQAAPLLSPPLPSPLAFPVTSAEAVAALQPKSKSTGAATPTVPTGAAACGLPQASRVAGAVGPCDLGALGAL